MDVKERLKILREEIERVDGNILQLLNERAKIALEVGEAKREGYMDLYDPRREGENLHRLTQKTGLFPRQAVITLFREIMSACRSLETELTVAYFGPPGSYTHLASIQHFGSSIHARAEEGIQEVFEAVERNRASYGVVPIENSTEGTVVRTLDMFLEYEVRICAEVLLPIHHSLLSRSGQFVAVRRICSHPQALGQCRNWVGKNFPQAQLVETASTSKAAEIAASDETCAAIASSFAGNLHGLNIIASRIEDSLHNTTRFLVLGKKEGERTGRDKTSMLFSISHTAGALCRILNIFGDRRVNLTKIESRPQRGKPWEYVFFTDVEGNAVETPLHDALLEVKRNVLFMKLLGSYPRASTPEKGE